MLLELLYLWKREKNLPKISWEKSRSKLRLNCQPEHYIITLEINSANIGVFICIINICFYYENDKCANIIVFVTDPPFFRINIDNIDTYACAVPDFLAAGGIVTDEALLASSSQVIGCVNQDRKDRKSRTESGLPVCIKIIILFDAVY